MQANRRLREDLEEANANYQELITAAKKVLRRKKLTQQQNKELIKHNKELQDKVQMMDAEYTRLKKRSQALDGLTILADAARHI